MLLSCLKSWSQSNSFTGGQNDSIFISIDYIRLANEKLIENKYNKIIIGQQDSIINLHIKKYDAITDEVKVLQNKLYNAESMNKELNKSLKKIDNKNKFLGGIAITSTIAFVVCILFH